MHTDTVELTDDQRKRLESAAAATGRTPAQLLNGLVQTLLEEYLEDLEDGIAATEIMRRVKSGEEKTIPWAQVEAELDILEEENDQ